MVHGKKGFDRLLCATKNVINESLNWLICDKDGKGELSPTKIGTSSLTMQAPDVKLLSEISPIETISSPVSSLIDNIRSVGTSTLNSIAATGDKFALEDAAVELYEWFSLVRLGSPRILADDIVNPYLSKYTHPESGGESISVVKMSWKGFIAGSWLRELLVKLLTSTPSQSWFYLSSSTFSTTIDGSSDEVVILRPERDPGNYMTLEIITAN